MQALCAVFETAQGTVFVQDVLADERIHFRTDAVLTCICLSARYFRVTLESRAPHVTLTSHRGH
jgi:hypothetical protein